MAGTDKSLVSEVSEAPAVILVEPQLGENIGTAARAMANFALAEMRIVNPRDGWPSEKARAASSGADAIVDAARLFDTAEEAVADLNFIYAATARERDMVKKVVGPAEGAQVLRRRQGDGEKTGILFGRERWGLNNDEVALADEILTFPTNPGFSSLNLAQSVLLVGYEWFKSGLDEESQAGAVVMERTFPAKREDVLRFFEHFEAALDEANFLRPPEKRPAMVRNLRNLFHRAQLTDQDVRTLRGVVAAFERRHERAGK